MNFTQFEARIKQWPTISFTTIILSRHHNDHEIYAIDDSSTVKTRLFLCQAEDENHASLLIKQFTFWLMKFNAAQRALQEDKACVKISLLSE
ncbi:hypothetical protein ACLHDD_05725 [Pantoea sp. NSTU24]|uniref:hypothetical protein n=1 Tax=Pantoea sp. NSTU24 TaxID=3391144 RepID=UPI003D0515A7